MNENRTIFGHWALTNGNAILQNSNRRGKMAWAFKMKNFFNSQICSWVTLLCVIFHCTKLSHAVYLASETYIFSNKHILIKKCVSVFSWMGNNARIWQLHFIRLFIYVKWLGSFISKYILDWELSQNQNHCLIGYRYILIASVFLIINCADMLSD